jgi:hypothetical protein
MRVALSPIKNCEFLRDIGSTWSVKTFQLYLQDCNFVDQLADRDGARICMAGRLEVINSVAPSYSLRQGNNVSSFNQ